MPYTKRMPQQRWKPQQQWGGMQGMPLQQHVGKGCISSNSTWGGMQGMPQQQQQHVGWRARDAGAAAAHEVGGI